MFELIKAAERQGWLKKLIYEAHESIPRNAKLLAFIQKLESTYNKLPKKGVLTN